MFRGRALHRLGHRCAGERVNIHRKIRRQSIHQPPIPVLAPHRVRGHICPLPAARRDQEIPRVLHRLSPAPEPAASVASVAPTVVDRSGVWTDQFSENGPGRRRAESLGLLLGYESLPRGPADPLASQENMLRHNSRRRDQIYSCRARLKVAAFD